MSNDYEKEISDIIEDENLWPSNKCWFCENDNAVSEVEYQAEMHNNSTIRVPVPRCHECKNIQDQLSYPHLGLGWFFGFFIGVMGIGLGGMRIYSTLILSRLMIPDSVFNTFIIIGLVVAVLFGFAYAWFMQQRILKKSSAKRLLGNFEGYPSELEKFPKIKKLQDLGWTIVEKSNS